jgi:16S rRNA (cytosine1402-N4)-methyltransferase
MDAPSSPLPPAADSSPGSPPEAAPVHRRRPRYSGRNPRRFEEKYKEHDAAQYAADVEKIVATGKTLAGTHRPILVPEILEVLRPRPGERVVDCTLGYGGHARELLSRVVEGGASGVLLGLDVDPLELPRTETRLRAAGHGAAQLIVRKSNYAGLAKVLGELQWDGADVILADLGVSSMQLDNPERGFTYKHDGPLDLRMNPQRGDSAADWLAKASLQALETVLQEFSDEPRAREIASGLVVARERTPLRRTRALGDAVRELIPGVRREEQDLTIRRVFQSLRIAVNDEFAAMDTWLRNLPGCLRPGGRVAVLTFHSGEDRRVKQAFKSGREAGIYSEIAREVIRPGPEELRSNPRSGPAKLRWAVRSMGTTESAEFMV